MTDPRSRWRYRFDNYKRAFTLLREGVELMEARPLSQLEKEGLIQRFEYSWELALKVMKDYLEAEGVAMPTVTPASVIRAAFAANIIADGDAWMQALDARSRMAHVYNFAVFKATITDIGSRYLPLFDALHLFGLERY